MGRFLAEVLIILMVGRALPLVAAETPPNQRFAIQRQDDECWLVEPDGRRFFSLGVCCVNQGASAKEWDPANPGYAASKHYADSNAWAVAALGRLKAWGFTTVGGYWDVTIGGSNKPIRGRIGAGMEPVFDEPSVRVVNISGLNGNVRNIAALELPAQLFGKKRLRRGDTIGFRSNFTTHCRGYRTEWTGQFVLGS